MTSHPYCFKVKDFESNKEKCSLAYRLKSALSTPFSLSFTWAANMICFLSLWWFISGDLVSRICVQPPPSINQINQNLTPTLRQPTPFKVGIPYKTFLFWQPLWGKCENAKWKSLRLCFVLILLQLQCDFTSELYSKFADEINKPSCNEVKQGRGIKKW